MKLKNYWKRFWTLDRHHAAGFTLVELIVVIAILAILAGVGIPVYSGYIDKTNHQLDITLAGNIESALTLAHYSNTLTPGAAVVVYFDDQDVYVYNTNDPTDTSAHNAMVAAFGDDYPSTLRLKWSGWEDQMGVAANSTMMGYVNSSNFKPDNMGVMLDQVQTVVNAAAGYFAGGGSVPEDSALSNYLDNAGIPYETIDSNNAGAIANAMVFVVADTLSATDTSSTTFWNCWKRNRFDQMTDWDAVTRKTASYAMVYATATYVDSVAGTDFCSRLGGGPNEILNNQTAVFNEIKGATSGPVYEAYTAYKGDGSTSSLMYKDAMAFLAYMQGVSSSADSLTGSTDLYNDQYFNDGTVLNYVTDYVSISDVLLNVDVEGGALVFFYNGETVTCLPLDY